MSSNNEINVNENVDPDEVITAEPQPNVQSKQRDKKYDRTHLQANQDNDPLKWYTTMICCEECVEICCVCIPFCCLDCND